MTNTIYLLHFSTAYKHARHYVGFTTNLDARLADHAAGQGARLLAVVRAAGISWQCVRTWQGDRKLERAIKRRKDTPRLCPICAGPDPLQARSRERAATGKPARGIGLLRKERKQHDFKTENHH